MMENEMNIMGVFERHHQERVSLIWQNHSVGEYIVAVCGFQGSHTVLAWSVILSNSDTSDMIYILEDPEHCNSQISIPLIQCAVLSFLKFNVE